MSLKQVADETVAEIQRAFPDADLSDETRAKISSIIEKSLARTVEQTSHAHRRATVVCCGPEADLAHKINEEVRRANIALTANLMALR
jgi:acetylornithine deacetylase/succinyl-diaminopimelate desuccinylase-like protein